MARTVRALRFWAVLAFAIAIAGTTALDESAAQTGSINASLTALFLILAAGLDIAGLYRLFDLTVSPVGVWLAAAPYSLSYEGSIATAHTLLGFLLAVVGIVQWLVGVKVFRTSWRKPS